MSSLPFAKPKDFVTVHGQFLAVPMSTVVTRASVESVCGDVQELTPFFFGADILITTFQEENSRAFSFLKQFLKFMSPPPGFSYFV